MVLDAGDGLFAAPDLAGTCRCEIPAHHGEKYVSLAIFTGSRAGYPLQYILLLPSRPSPSRPLKVHHP